MNQRRARQARPGHEGQGPVLYWMHRDHRATDNWALCFALKMAQARQRPLLAVHCLDPDYPGARPEHFAFLLAGLAETERGLSASGVPLARLLGKPAEQVAALAGQLDACAVVTDFDPLRHKRAWLAGLAALVQVPVWEVDARNVVPCFVASNKSEYMARTLRPKINRLLGEFFEPYPAEQARPKTWAGPPPGYEPDAVARALGLLGAGLPRFFAPGEQAARGALEAFVAARLAGYAVNRNNPALDGQSGLSPWLHFGMLSAQRAALEADKAEHAPREDREAFLEELIVRRELADNFCLHNPHYDTPECFPAWARASLAAHADDPRPVLYTPEEMEEARTQDPAWNAAQRQMVLTGKMHGYMRMYWCKKILEWSPDPAAAQAFALDQNDRWSLDGRDPNGYAGVAWSIGGVHDRPWFNRPVFGQVRYMNAAGLARKFDVGAYVRSVDRLGR